MNILILGSGGREHTFAWKVSQSPLCNALFVAPGNSGTASIATNIDVSVTDFQGLKNQVLIHAISMVVVGPEDPLVKGIYDFFSNEPELQHVAVIGPTKAAAQLEGSKEFAKEFLYRHKIPTAAYESFTKHNIEAGFAFLDLPQGKECLLLKMSMKPSKSFKTCYWILNLEPQAQRL